jgi:hypothetical protein
MKTKKKDLWFVAKTYGWGWTPATWQGWLISGVAAFLIAWDSAIFVNIEKPSDNVLFGYLFRIFVYILALIFICFLKGEKPRWRWGK